MELLASLGIGILTACGLYLILRPQTFSVVLGFTLLSYAVNALIFFGGRLNATDPPLVAPDAKSLADPLPQALVLTAIVIGFGMTAYLVALSLRAKSEISADQVDAPEGR